jgi:4-diphosphocytidyl-2-C-methyl-D-erythritol kinase
LWALDISTEELQTISATLGSDVPFFFSTQTAYATGRGEHLTSMSLEIPYWILTLTPKIQVSTAWAYANVRLKQVQNRPNLHELLVTSMNNPEVLRASLVNDFEESVFRDFTNIAKLKELLLNEGAELALMSGSGSSVFGFFSSEEMAMHLRSELSNTYSASITQPQFKVEIN